MFIMSIIVVRSRVSPEVAQGLFGAKCECKIVATATEPTTAALRMQQQCTDRIVLANIGGSMHEE